MPHSLHHLHVLILPKKQIHLPLVKKQIVRVKRVNMIQRNDWYFQAYILWIIPIILGKNTSTSLCLLHVCSIVSFHIDLAQLFQIICHICSFKRHCIPSLKHFLGPDISLDIFEDSFTHSFCILKVSPCSVYLPHLSQVQSSSLAIYNQTSCGGRRTWAWPVLSRALSWSKNLIWNTLPGFPVTTFYNSWDGRKLYGFWMLIYYITHVLYTLIFIYTHILTTVGW